MRSGVVLGHLGEARASLASGDPARRRWPSGRGFATNPHRSRRSGTSAAQLGLEVIGRRSPCSRWDVGHNPLGRAHLLADLLRDRFDVEIWGAQFERYGTDIWLPHPRLAHPDPAVSRAPTSRSSCERWSGSPRRIDADAIYVSKPRFPALGLGVIAKELWNRPLIVDVDDFEPSFFAERSLAPNGRAAPSSG